MSNSYYYKLYASDGVTPVYTFPLVQEDNSPQDSKDYVEIEGLRGVGSVIISGSTKAWNLRLRFVLVADNYEAMIAKMDALQTTIVLHTHYVLKIDRTTSSSQSYNVMRLQPFEFGESDFRNTYQEVSCTLRVNSWS